MTATTIHEQLREAKLATRMLMGELEKMRWERDEALRRVQELEQQQSTTRAEA